MVNGRKEIARMIGSPCYYSLQEGSRPGVDCNTCRKTGANTIIRPTTPLSLNDCPQRSTDSPKPFVDIIQNMLVRGECDPEVRPELIAIIQELSPNQYHPIR
jgi:hypothetical protein